MLGRVAFHGRSWAQLQSGASGWVRFAGSAKPLGYRVSGARALQRLVHPGVGNPVYCKPVQEVAEQLRQALMGWYLKRLVLPRLERRKRSGLVVRRRCSCCSAGSAPQVLSDSLQVSNFRWILVTLLRLLCQLLSPMQSTDNFSRLSDPALPNLVWSDENLAF